MTKELSHYLDSSSKNPKTEDAVIVHLPRDNGKSAEDEYSHRDTAFCKLAVKCCRYSSSRNPYYVREEAPSLRRAASPLDGTPAGVGFLPSVDVRAGDA